MGSPYNIAGSASGLFFQNRASAEYQALSVIAESLAHPQRTLLSSFVQQAVDKEYASRFLLDEVYGQDKATLFEFLATWISLLKKVQPVVCKDLETSLKRRIWKRDGGQCCISKAQDGKKNSQSLLFAYILPPSLFSDSGIVENEKLYKMLAAFIGESQLRNLRLLMNQDSLCFDQDRSHQLILLSPRIFDHFKNGRLSFQGGLSATTKDLVGYSVKVNDLIPSVQVETFRLITLENRASGLASLPDAQLLKVHYRFADALAWLEVSEYMKQTYGPLCNMNTQTTAGYTTKLSTKKNPWCQWCFQLVPRIFEHLWVHTPIFFRAFAYKHLASIAHRLCGHTGSDRTYRLPFNLYLRVANSDWASKHQAEFRTLQLVQKHTQIPAPRGIDTLQYTGSSFLLMAGLPGEKIGLMLPTMTDEQIQAVVQDLKKYTAELRQIPNRSGSGSAICNALGGGILDWRIGDSQREELTFQDEAEFNQYLTRDLPLNEDARKQILKTHSVKHEIVFTHADLNPRNILVDENGKISGIVDWECAGWYPEYWEYTKAHFTVRYTIRWIADVIDQVFLEYRDELQVEDLLSSMVPPW